MATILGKKKVGKYTVKMVGPSSLHISKQGTKTFKKKLLTGAEMRRVYAHLSSVGMVERFMQKVQSNPKRKRNPARRGSDYHEGTLTAMRQRVKQFLKGEAEGTRVTIGSWFGSNKYSARLGTTKTDKGHPNSPHTWIGTEVWERTARGSKKVPLPKSNPYGARAPKWVRDALAERQYLLKELDSLPRHAEGWGIQRLLRRRLKVIGDKLDKFYDKYDESI